MAKDLTQLRERMNEITDAMMTLFVERLEVSKAIGDYKRENGLPIYQPEREAALKKALLKDAVYPELQEAFLECLFKASKELQDE